MHVNDRCVLYERAIKFTMAFCPLDKDNRCVGVVIPELCCIIKPPMSEIPEIITRQLCLFTASPSVPIGAGRPWNFKCESAFASFV